MTPKHPAFFLRLYFSEGEMMGPGKAMLLEGIAQSGSISAAGRAMGMSYKRAWMLVEAMNAMFAEPLVLSARGGPGGGGAQLSPMGERVLALFRRIEAEAAAAAEADIAALRGLLADISEEK